MGGCLECEQGDGIQEESQEAEQGKQFGNRSVTHGNSTMKWLSPLKFTWRQLRLDWQQVRWSLDYGTVLVTGHNR